MTENKATHTCTRCGVERSVDEFYVQNRATGRLNPWCKQCYRAWYASRGGYSTTRTLTCIWCDSSYESPYARSKFCSQKCKRSSAAARRRGNSPRKPDRNCVHCGMVMPRTMRADAKFCSEECNSAAHAITRKMAKRAGRKKRFDDPLIERNYIAKRDNYRCGLCGGKVDMTVKHPDPMYGSIDHIVPKAEGGSDELPNLQLAHLKCNLQKQHRGEAQQLRLIG